MVAKRQTNIILKRAYFDEGFNGTLEEILAGSFQKLETARDRVVPMDLISNRAFISYEDHGANGTVLRVFDYEVGPTGVINLDTSDVSEAVEEFEHPDKKDFLKKQMVILIKDNFLFCCGLENKAGTLCSDMVLLAQRAKTLVKDVSMKIADIPDAGVLERLNRVGVKKMSFDLANYFETLSLGPKQLPGSRILGMLLGSELSSRDVKRRAETIGKVHLSRGKFRADEVQKDQWLTEIGKEVLEGGNSESYTIELEDDSTIRPDELQKSKHVKLSKHANTYSYSNAVSELLQFSKECINDGSLGK